MKVLAVFSTLIALTWAAPHGYSLQNFGWPVAPYFPTVYHGFTPYHTDAEANCHHEKEVFTIQSCLPKFEIVCKDKEVEWSSIVYKRKCRPIVSQVCGNHHPVSVTMQETEDGEVEEVEDEELPQENKIYYLAAGAPQFRHRCWDVTHDYCYLEPEIETGTKTVPQCHVVNKPVCSDKKIEAPKVVCTKEEELEHTHEDGTTHSHEDGDEEHDHDEEHTHEDGTTHTHEGGDEEHSHEDVRHTHETGVTHTHEGGDMEHTHEAVEHTHEDGTTHAHEGGDEKHSHEAVEHTHEDGTTHAHEGGDKEHTHQGVEHTHPDGTTHTHEGGDKPHNHVLGTPYTHLVYHQPHYHPRPVYTSYYYYPTQNLHKKFGL